MTLNWDASGDFEEVLDTLEEVRVFRAGCDAQVTYPKAWRFVESAEPANDADVVVRRDAVWHLPAGGNQRDPAVGDRLIDAAGDCWTLSRVERLRAATRFRCESRSTRLRAADAVWLRLERATWADGPDGPVVSGWTIETPAVSGVVELLASTPSTSDPSAESQRYRITLAEPIEAGPHHRLVGPGGEAFRLADAVTAPPPGEAPSVAATREVPG